MNAAEKKAKGGGHVSLRAVSKRFEVGKRGADSLLARAADLFSGRGSTRTLLAVDGVSLEVAPGEVVGIVGRNGSGKSTLLRLAAGIYEPDAGEVSVRGEILYVNGFNHGAKPRLSMRENIYLGGAVLGLSRSEVAARFEQIVDFSDLRDFVDAKVYQFSSGMVTRLNFSIFIHCAAREQIDVLLVDEVFGAGGDEAFRAKADAKMRDLLRSGATSVFVSHGLGDVERYCDRAVLLDRGQIVAQGVPAEVVKIYRERSR
jgi:ABC-type polysaccharide/polyol phosphate transport system ATPase subunit